MKFRKMMGAATVAAVAAFAYPAAAEGTGATGSTQAPSPAAVPITSDDLEAYAAANAQVNELGRKWAERLYEAEDEQEQIQIRDQAEEEMIQAIEDEGLTVEQYSMIALEEQRSPEVRQAIDQHRTLDQ